MKTGQAVRIVADPSAGIAGTYEHDGATVVVRRRNWYEGALGTFAGRDASRPLRPMVVEIAGEGRRWFTVAEVEAL